MRGWFNMVTNFYRWLLSKKLWDIIMAEEGDDDATAPYLRL